VFIYVWVCFAAVAFFSLLYFSKRLFPLTCDVAFTSVKKKNDDGQLSDDGDSTATF
jgi:hypothetical protein